MLYLTNQPLGLVYYLYPEAERRGVVDDLELLQEGHALSPRVIAAEYRGRPPAPRVIQSPFNEAYLVVPKDVPWTHLVSRGDAQMLVMDLRELYAPLEAEVAPGMSWENYALEPEARDELRARLRQAPRLLRDEQIRLTLIRQHLGRRIEPSDLEAGAQALTFETLRRAWGTPRGTQILLGFSRTEAYRFVRQEHLRRLLGTTPTLRLVVELFESLVLPQSAAEVHQCLIYLHQWCVARGLNTSRRSSWAPSITPQELILMENNLCPI